MDRLLALLHRISAAMYALTYNLPNGKSFAFAPRSGTSSLGAAAVRQFFPEKWDNQTDGMAHRALPFTIDDQFNDCVVVIRNPVERFISLCARTATPPSMALAKLYWGLGLGHKRAVDRPGIETTSVDWLYHFFPIANRIANCNLIPFPSLEKAATALGLNNLPHINKTDEKPTLTSDEEDIVRKIYSEDISLWKSLR